MCSVPVHMSDSGPPTPRRLRMRRDDDSGGPGLHFFNARMKLKLFEANHVFLIFYAITVTKSKEGKTHLLKR